ncbi:MAG: hypothetical protein EA392_05195 [Cryomorphaceae bacterium]|nr:MAG: hypothetical protein EA392_05195 [Cryomorphaceae bacterium]
MDSKITLSFDAQIIELAKEFAARNNTSVSRLTEFLLRKVCTGEYKDLESLPISDWVEQVAEGKAEYHTKPRSRKSTRDEFFDSRK